MRSVFALAFLLAVPISAHADAPAPLRIGLDHTFRHSTTLSLSCDRQFTLRDAVTNQPLAHGAGYTVYKVQISALGMTLADAVKNTPIPLHGASALSVLPEPGGFVRVARLDSQRFSAKEVSWHSYRGFLTVRPEPDTTLRVINTVGLEPYLYGVIPAEIGARVPMEAMKAQAVAARTYALKNRGKCMTESGFDLDDTTHCEGYYGLDGETALSNAAVDATRNQILTYRGQLIDAIYSTDSGGITACDLSGECPYLQAVKDCDSADGVEYAASGKYHSWAYTFMPTQMASLLARDPRTHVTQFVSLTIDGLDPSGRITTAAVTGADGTLKTVTGPQLRQILGYDTLRSTRVVLTRTPDGAYRFDGKGWGHGMGMSQDGAIAMAGPPYRKTYTQILTHYYVGAKVGSDISLVASTRPATRPGF